jgi:L-amino acid N-acyltransferase YncA
MILIADFIESIKTVCMTNVNLSAEERNLLFVGYHKAVACRESQKGASLLFSATAGFE